MLKKILISLLVIIFLAGASYYVIALRQKSSKATPLAATVNRQGVTDTEILLGSSSALSGAAASLGKDITSGATVAISQINDAGGINGRKLVMISYDDQYDPPKAVENTQKLIHEDKVFALFNFVGTPTGVRVAPLVEEAKIPMVGMFTGANIFRDPLKKYIFNVRSSYYQETELAIRHFVDDQKLKNIAVIYQSDAFGLDGLEGVKIALAKRGMELAALGSYERGTNNVEFAVNEINKSKADVVIMIGTYSPLAKTVKLIKDKKPNTIFHTVSFVGPEAFMKELGNNTSNVFVTLVVPPTYYSDLFDGVRDYTEGVAKYTPGTEPTFGGLEGYINTKVLAEGIRLAGKDLSRESLLAALESMQNYDVGIGANVSFDPADHQGLGKVYLTNFEKGKFVLVPVK